MPRKLDGVAFDQQVLLLDEAGVPRVRIAEQLGTDPKTVRSALKRLGRWSEGLTPAEHKAQQLRRLAAARAGERNEAMEALVAGAEKRRVGLPARGEEIRETKTQDRVELESVASSRIRNTDDLLRYRNVDRDAMEIASEFHNSWEAQGPNGEVVTLHQVKVGLKPKRLAGPNILDAVESLINGAQKARTGPARTAPAIHTRRSQGDVRQDVIIADPHVAKLAYGRTTGGPDYDARIAESLLWDSSLELMELGERRQDVAFRSIDLLGDYFHYDVPAGTTTGGTPQDRDTRLQRMIEIGADMAVRIIERSAERVRTQVLLVPGNHDETLSWSLQRILIAEFRRHPNVEINTELTRRKYDAWGRCLLGFNHGDKKPEALATTMPIEVPKLWGESVYREIHMGHLHNEREKQKLVEMKGTVTHAGVIVRTHRSLSAADQWHADEQWIGAPRGMSAWYYHKRGALLGMDMTSPPEPEETSHNEDAKLARMGRGAK